MRANIDTLSDNLKKMGQKNGEWLHLYIKNKSSFKP